MTERSGIKIQLRRRRGVAKLISKLKVDTEKYDLYSAAADVSDEGKIGSWMKAGGVRVYTHTHRF